MSGKSEAASGTLTSGDGTRRDPALAPRPSWSHRRTAGFAARGRDVRQVTPARVTAASVTEARHRDDGGALPRYRLSGPA